MADPVAPGPAQGRAESPAPVPVVVASVPLDAESASIGSCATLREEAVTLVGRSPDPCSDDPDVDEAGAEADLVFEPDPWVAPAREAPAPDAARVDAVRFEVFEAEAPSREVARPVAPVELLDDVVAAVVRRAPLDDLSVLEASLVGRFDRGSGSTSVAGSCSIHGPTH